MRHITDKELFDTDKSCLVQTMLSLSQNDQKKLATGQSPSSAKKTTSVFSDKVV